MTVELQDALYQYFGRAVWKMAEGLEEILRRVFAEATIEGIESLPRISYLQADLASGIQHILSLDVRTVASKIIHPGWTGGYTVAQLDARGTIIAAASHPVGRVYDLYGQNLYGYALAKAVLEEFLRRSGRTDGVPANYDYLVKLVRDQKLLPRGAWSNSNPDGAIGVSGAEAGPAYIEGFGPEMTPSTERAAVNFAAGAADITFAAGLVQYLQQGHRMTHVAEPWIVNVARLLN